MVNAIFLVLLVAISTVVVGLFILKQKESRLQSWMPWVISVGTGILISLSLTEFLPHSFAHSSYDGSYLILLGVLSVLFAEKYLAPLLNFDHEHHCHTHHSDNHGFISHRAACSSIGCILICAFIDGLEIPAGFQIDPQVGWLISSGMIFHAVPEGALVAGIGLSGGLSRKATKICIILVGAFILLGATVSLVASQFFDFQKVILPLATGILLYVSLGHLLPVSLKTRWGLWGILLGIIINLLLSHSH